MGLSERRDPTHILRIEVPLNLSANPAAESWDIESAMREAMTVVLSLARVSTLGLLSDDIAVTLNEVED